MPDQDVIARALAVKKQYEGELLLKRNVVGVGVGFRQRRGRHTQEVCIVVSVRQKVPRASLAAHDIIPPVLDGVPVDIQETGTFRAQPLADNNAQPA